MKKSHFSIVMLLMLIWIGCKKNELDRKSRNDLELIENAKIWYNSQLQSIKESEKKFRVPTRALPIWDSCIVTQTATDEYSIFVKTQGRHLSSVDVGILSSLVFSYKDGKIVSGNLVEII